MASDLKEARHYDWAQLVRDAWGDDFNKPDVVYQFSNGVEKKDSKAAFYEPVQSA